MTIRRACGALGMAGSLAWTGGASAASWAQTSPAPTDATGAGLAVGFLCGLAVAGVVGCCFSVLRSAVTRREQAAMRSRIAHQDEAARQFQDDLVQGVQGLIMTLELVAQNNPTARTAIEDALRRAETFLLASRDRSKAQQGADDEAG
ncbi:MAG: hypothetical protein ACOVMT_10515 [Caulobacter sp.]